MQMGSGTKPFTAAAVMQLVDQGKVKLSDKVHTHVDNPLRDNWNTTLVELFGPMAANITVD
jgi:CubicO group peptidase (beta-lactamase class C family)